MFLVFDLVITIMEVNLKNLLFRKKKYSKQNLSST